MLLSLWSSSLVGVHKRVENCNLKSSLIGLQSRMLLAKALSKGLGLVFCSVFRYMISLSKVVI